MDGRGEAHHVKVLIPLGPLLSPEERALLRPVCARPAVELVCERAQLQELEARHANEPTSQQRPGGEPAAAAPRHNKRRRPKQKTKQKTHTTQHEKKKKKKTEGASEQREGRILRQRHLHFSFFQFCFFNSGWGVESAQPQRRRHQQKQTREHKSCTSYALLSWSSPQSLVRPRQHIPGMYTTPPGWPVSFETAPAFFARTRVLYLDQKIKSTINRGQPGLLRQTPSRNHFFPSVVSSGISSNSPPR